MYRVDVLATGEIRWASNALRFPTEGEAEEYARSLASRWMAVEKASVVPVETPEREIYTPGTRRLAVDYGA